MQGQVRLLILTPPKAGFTPQEFQDHWRHPYGTLARGIRLMRRYIQNHRILGAADISGDSPYRSPRHAGTTSAGKLADQLDG